MLPDLGVNSVSTCQPRRATRLIHIVLPQTSTNLLFATMHGLTSSVQRMMETPELLSLICDFSGKNDRVTLLSVSRRTFACAAASLWKEISDVMVLFKLFPGVVITKTKKTRCLVCTGGKRTYQNQMFSAAIARFKELIVFLIAVSIFASFRSFSTFTHSKFGRHA